MGTPVTNSLAFFRVLASFVSGRMSLDRSFPDPAMLRSDGLIPTNGRESTQSTSLLGLSSFSNVRSATAPFRHDSAYVQP
eukprot:CAMPEP_0177765644 /NCGR_PEP_ID=MMETSP0491_2-20121128/8100_1 /TAXON_ID=63592 /ORGANISM="Tetraselmis chuii, Strain PLY429" /LENGTH=79 /DNA_ID=CAMNT_0019282003 /DNA_START=371 /DNA_END=610 /DNA_ORIENTATION=+